MTNNLELIETEEVGLNNLQIYQQDKALIDMQISTAKKYPRNLKQVVSNCKAIISLDKEFAESCLYTLPKGKKVVGPSINLAKLILSEMGNIRAENRVVSYDATHVTCEAMCFDLEKNLALRTQIKRSIVGSSGRYSEDLATITGNAGNAIALRNVIFTVVGANIVNAVFKAVKNSISGDISTDEKLNAKKVVVIKGLKENYSSFKLTDEEIFKACGKSSLEHIGEDEILILMGYENAIKSGEVTFESVFRPVSPFTPNVKINTPEPENRLLLMIESTKDRVSLEKLKKECKDNDSRAAYDAKYKILK